MNKTWTREQVAERILAGDTLVIWHDYLLRIPPTWLAAHPGGALAILHFVGRDATDEIDVYHPEFVLSKKIKGFIVGRVEVGPNGWESLIPPVMNGWVRRKEVGTKDEWTWHQEAMAERTHDHDPKAPSAEILLVEKASGDKAPSLSTLTPAPCTLSLTVQNRHAQAYRELHKRIIGAGLYQTRYTAGYGPEVLRYLLLAAGSTYAYQVGWIKTSALLLGMLWHQLVFTVHDLGHNGVTHIWLVDRLVGICIASLVGGLSLGWWVDNHNIHHLVTNHPSHDPDIQHIPFFAISPSFLRSIYSSYYKRTMPLDAAAAVLLKVQHKIYFLVMSLARFNLYANSYGFLLKNAFNNSRPFSARWTYWLELMFIGIFWVWYSAVLRGCGSWGNMFAFLLITHVVPSPLHVQIVLSHFARSTDDLGPKESFVHRQLRTTTDVICPDSLAFLHGGLHLQVTHHLFPRLPRHNLRAASLLVKEFAAAESLEYAEFGFIHGNGEVLAVLKNVAEQAKVIGMVADANAKKSHVH